MACMTYSISILVSTRPTTSHTTFIKSKYLGSIWAYCTTRTCTIYTLCTVIMTNFTRCRGSVIVQSSSTESWARWCSCVMYIPIYAWLTVGRWTSTSSTARLTWTTHISILVWRISYNTRAVVIAGVRLHKHLSCNTFLTFLITISNTTITFGSITWLTYWSCRCCVIQPEWMTTLTDMICI
jgi:hypothetical protein